ncbi:MAG: hypothetical protein MHM6MM_004928, partial [Cercozoa sp. M6MM]
AFHQAYAAVAPDDGDDHHQDRLCAPWHVQRSTELIKSQTPMRVMASSTMLIGMRALRCAGYCSLQQVRGAMLDEDPPRSKSKLNLSVRYLWQCLQCLKQRGTSQR